MNNDKIKIKDSINEANKKVNIAINLMVETRCILNKNEIKLSEKGWTGSTNEKCREINNVLKQYQNELVEIMGEIIMIVKKLDQDTKQFNSTKLRAANSIKEN